jgi:hypothetical protein
MQQIYINDCIDKSHFKYLKYILGVNKKFTNLAVLSELGRYPLYFSVVLSMLKYWFRIDNMESGLLFDAYIANQRMASDNTECWLSWFQTTQNAGCHGFRQHRMLVVLY